MSVLQVKLRNHNGAEDIIRISSLRSLRLQVSRSSSFIFFVLVVKSLDGFLEMWTEEDPVTDELLSTTFSSRSSRFPRMRRTEACSTL